ncbi:MAG: lipid IV(A) 3-deoxy-D-manno-octulosonic acid transferase [Rhodocyclaceae bacterium]|nr:lipid IV(A) 3-deoxy-D-manno-octulosonic acid transferase [Rhodocyclaceae bacterium]
MFRAAYTLVWLLVLPIALLRLAWRGRRQPAYRQHVMERLGYFGTAGSFDGAWWIHAVSVGETRASEPLVKALLARDPEARVLISVMTPTGRQTASELFARWGSRVHVTYLPYDLPPLVRRFLRHFRPRVGLLMETEVWPNLIHEAAEAHLPMALVNARLSERSARRYARLGRFARATFSRLAGVAAQSRDDARRLAGLGAPAPVVTGSVKFDVTVPSGQRVLGDSFRSGFGKRPIVLAASTRDGEEAPLLDAFLAQAPTEALLVVVPRHPQRFDEVGALIASRRVPWARRSQSGPLPAELRVWLGDSMGEMFAYYGAADVAIIGGSWQPLGGQNLIEACAVGLPTILGPHTFNFAEISELAIAAGAAVRADEVANGVACALALIADPTRRAAMSAAALAFSATHGGATEMTLHLLDSLLERPGFTPPERPAHAPASMDRRN